MKAFHCAALLWAALLLVQPACAQSMSYADLAKLPQPRADERIAYGSDALQFGDLRLPPGKGPHPVVIVVHGGCWFAEYDLQHLAAFCDALTRAGVATWSIEYRRVGNQGGAWPGTFQDVAKGADYLRELAKKYPLDLERVIAIGHSAGGQLVLWLAARANLPPDSPLYTGDPLRLRGVVALAAVSDLRGFRPNCGDAVTKLLGGSPAEVEARYEQTSPLELLPLRVPVTLIHGLQDRIVPPDQSRAFVGAAKSDQVNLVTPDNAGHFELVSPRAEVWPVIEKSVLAMLGLEKTKAAQQ